MSLVLDQTILPASGGAHYSSPEDNQYSRHHVSVEPYATVDGSDAYVYVEVATPEGYTLARLTPTDAATCGAALIVAASAANQKRTEYRNAWYGNDHEPVARAVSL